MLKINQSILKYFLGFVIDTISFVHPETEMILTNLQSSHTNTSGNLGGVSFPQLHMLVF